MNMSESDAETLQGQTASTVPKAVADLGIDEPMQWPVTKKLNATLAGSGYCFAL